MLPSRDSGCKGTKFYPYQQISCLFFKFFYRNNAVWAVIPLKNYLIRSAALTSFSSSLTPLRAISTRMRATSGRQDAN